MGIGSLSVQVNHSQFQCQSKEVYKTYQIPTRIKNFISSLCEGLELCSNCSTPHPHDAPSFKVFTFKNPYLGNTCVPFQHWTCSFHCAREVEVPARREQVDQAKLQDR